MKLPRPGTPERLIFAAGLRALVADRSLEEVAREVGLSRKTVTILVRGDASPRPREKIRDIGEVPKCTGCGLRLFTKREQAAGVCGTCPRIDDFAGMRRERA